MPHRRADVLAHAVTLLDTHGLSALTMRRLGAELGVQPSAIYHHFPSKQALLAAVADEILARGARPRTASDWPDRLREADLSMSDLTLTTLARAHLDHAVLRQAKLDRTDLRGASLDGVDLLTAELRRTRLDLAGAVLLAELQGADVDTSV